MSTVKRVFFHFFEPTTFDDNNEPQLINLEPLFEHLYNQYREGRDNNIDEREFKRVYTYNGEPARLSDITIDYSTQYYHLIFERLSYAVPNVTTLYGDSERIDLEEDEYIGLEVSVLYDPHYHILMIQRNQDSLSPSAIESFLRTLIINAGVVENFSLSLVLDNNARERALRQYAYRKITARLSGSRAKGMLEKLFERCPQGIDTIEITFNAQKSRTSEIDHDFATELLEEYIEDSEVQKLKISSRENEESKVEPIDLINHKLQTYSIFDLRENRQLNAIRIFEEMVGHYLGGGYRNRILGMRNRLLGMR